MEDGEAEKQKDPGAEAEGPGLGVEMKLERSARSGRIGLWIVPTTMRKH